MEKRNKFLIIFVLIRTMTSTVFAFNSKVVLKFSLALFLSLKMFSVYAENIYNIVDFGANSNSDIINTEAINLAIKTCAENGGGRVLVPAGIYRTGTIVLRSNVNLHLESGARLLGSDQIEDFYIDSAIMGMLYAFEEKNISISGFGTIDGNSGKYFDFTRKHNYVGFNRNVTRQKENMLHDSVRLFKDGPVGYLNRPAMMVVFSRCEDINIQNASFVNSPHWTVRIADCDGVKISGIKIDNNCLVPNSDGIHCTTSRNVIISDCSIVGGDDAIAITGFGEELNNSGDFVPGIPDYSTRKIGNKVGICENILVNNCILKSHSAGIRVGYGNNNIRNCIFSDIIIFESNRGLGIFSRDRANIENIHFENISIQTQLFAGNWWGSGEPIHVSSIRQHPDIPVGKVKGIHFTNINATAEAGAVFYGTDESIIESVFLSNVHITVNKGLLSEERGGNLDLRPSYPMDMQLFEFDVAGFYIGYSNHFDLDNVSVNWSNGVAGYFTHGLEIENSKNISVRKFSGNSANPNFQNIMHERNNTNIQIVD